MYSQCSVREWLYINELLTIETEINNIYFFVLPAMYLSRNKW